MITKRESKNLNYEDYQDFLDAAEGFIKEPLRYDKDNETEQEFKDRVKERIELWLVSIKVYGGRRFSTICTGCTGYAIQSSKRSAESILGKRRHRKEAPG